MRHYLIQADDYRYLRDKLEEYSECFAICHKLFAMNLYPIAPFIAAESWHMLGSLSCLDGLNDNITGDLKKEVRLQKIVSPEEIQKLMIPKDLPLNVNIFVTTNFMFFQNSQLISKGGRKISRKHESGLWYLRER